LAALHPLEYVAMNALAGGTRGAYQAVSTSAAHAIACQTILEAWWQLDELSIPVGECKQVGLLFTRKLFRLWFCLGTHGRTNT
jgi:hypothetical protein